MRYTKTFIVDTLNEWRMRMKTPSLRLFHCAPVEGGRGGPQGLTCLRATHRQTPCGAALQFTLCASIFCAVAVFSFAPLSVHAFDTLDVGVAAGKPGDAASADTQPAVTVQPEGTSPADQPPPAEATPPPTDFGTESVSGQTLDALLARVTGILDTVVPFLIGLTVFIILWGIFTYITHAAEEEKRAEAKRFIIWGVIGVFCMLSLWGFVNLLLNSFTLETQIKPSDIPRVPTVNPL